MTLGEYLASIFLPAKDPVAQRFKSWLGKDARESFSERVWRATFKIFKRQDKEKW